MGTAISNDKKCSHCGFERVFLEMNCCTQEFLRFCPACGSFESFDYRYNQDGLIEKTVALPLSEIALTVRICPLEGGIDCVVWEAPLPVGADTDFVEHYLHHRHEELKQNHPMFACPDLNGLAQQHGGCTFCCVEQRLDKPSKWDSQPYLCLSRIGSGFEIKERNGQRVFLYRRARYKYRRSVGHGVICIENINSTTTYWRVFSQGTSENRAKRLWEAHTDERTHYGRSYMSLMVDGKLRLLKGTEAAI